MRDFLTLFLMALCSFAIAATIILAYATGAIFDDAQQRAVHEAELWQRTSGASTPQRDPTTKAAAQSPPG